MAVNEFRWADVTVKVPNKAAASGESVLLDRAYGVLRPGDVMALMGPSGSGKTTLLNVLAHRGVPPAAQLEGVVSIDGETATTAGIRRVSAYVEQEDSLIGSLTVRETVDFAARLSQVPASVRRDRVAEILGLLGIAGQADTRVGTPLQKGISGGQKRRVSVASQIITSPRVLFLDEPTSGLDSTASHEVISTIRRIAKLEGMIVVTSIHQPSTATFQLFDQVTFLSRGRTVYNGPVAALTEYFATTAHPVAAFFNPSEFVLDLINTDFVTDDADASDKLAVVDRLCAHWHAHADEWAAPPALAAESKRSSSSAEVTTSAGPALELRQTLTLLRRLAIKSRRDILAYYVRVVMYLGLAIMMGTVWLRLSTAQRNIQPFINAIFFSGAFMSFMSVAYIPAYLEDFSSYRKDRANGLYGPFAFVVSNLIIGLPFLFAIALIFSVVTYFMCNFHHSATGFFKYLMWLFLDLVAAESMTVFVSTAFPIFVVALALTAFANGLWMSVGGFLVSANVINKFWYYTFYWVNYQRYVFQGMMFNEFENRDYECDSACHCMYTSALESECKIEGTAVLESLGYSTENVGLWAGLVVALVAAYRLMTYLVLRYWHK
ncbi:P-loop containing nucleoside triphosphate hydrolase protein [Dipodascopsis tothii]|uniref:P-loop containing nucleoside triphosphate hydrolase protein n=1 Tax=Dipodascopsis tothii TaxID=44089 RepID=UPI0034CDCF47